MMNGEGDVVSGWKNKFTTILSNVTPAGMLAEQTGIPGPTAQKLVSSLARAGLLVASRGSGGGIRLARPAAAIDVAEIIEAVEGPIALTACVAEGRHDCSLEGSCKVQPHWGVVNGAVRGALAGISLASLAVAPKTPFPIPAMAGDEARV